MGPDSWTLVGVCAAASGLPAIFAAWCAWKAWRYGKAVADTLLIVFPEVERAKAGEAIEIPISTFMKESDEPAPRELRVMKIPTDEEFMRRKREAEGDPVEHEKRVKAVATEEIENMRFRAGEAV